MPRINCYLPVKVCITGRLGDAQLEQLSETIVRALSARISFAEQELTAADGGRYLAGRAEIIREDYDQARYEGGADSYRVPSYHGGGQPVSMRLHRRVSRRPWFIRKAINFHAHVGEFLDFVEDLISDPSELSGKVLYKDIYEELRWVSLWLVQVNQHYTLRELTGILSQRAMDLTRLRSNQILAYGLDTNERMRRKLIQIDEDGIVAREIPPIGNHNLRLASNFDG